MDYEAVALGLILVCIGGVVGRKSTLWGVIMVLVGMGWTVSCCAKAGNIGGGLFFAGFFLPVVQYMKLLRKMENMRDILLV